MSRPQERQEIDAVARLLMLRELQVLAYRAFEIDSELTSLGGSEDDMVDYIVLSIARRIIAEDMGEIVAQLIEEPGDNGRESHEEALETAGIAAHA